ncbi:MAG: hypothetical protein PH343_03610 [Nitrospira sp.]|nr:hypothetical protein [Nitrospira sp.]
MKPKIVYLVIPIFILFSTSCNYQKKGKNVDSPTSSNELQKQAEGSYPVHKEEVKPDTAVDYQKPAPPLTPEERQRLIEGTEKEGKKDKK